MTPTTPVWATSRAYLEEAGMYARTTRIHAARDRIDAGTRQFREVVAEFHGLDGFLGGQFLVDRRTGRVVATTFWQTEAAMVASDRHAESARLRAAETWGATVSPTVERYEVAYHELRETTERGA